MKYFLAWNPAGSSTRDISSRINKNLAKIDAMLQTLDAAYRLHLLDVLIKNGRGATPFEDELARNRLESFKRLFPREVEKRPFDSPGYLLVDVLQRLCASIALNPLYPDAFASGGSLMEYLHREESARQFQYVAICLEQIHL